MWKEIKAKVEAFLAWVYNWVTVLTGIVAGFVSYGLDALSAIVGSTDITPLLPPDKALKIITAVALLKGLHAFYLSRKA